MPETPIRNGHRTHDALWWVVFHQGAVDYTRSADEHDDRSTTRLLDTLRSGVEVQRPTSPPADPRRRRARAPRRPA